MQLNRHQSYKAILGATLLLCFLYQSVWIFSRTTKAKIYGTDIIHNNGKSINLIDAIYAVGDKTYYGTYLREDYDISKQYLEIRYLIFDPAISRSNNFLSSWGPLITFYIIVLIVTSIVFIRKDIISESAVFNLQMRWPFIQIVNNDIEDYDQHDIVSAPLDPPDQKLKTEIETEKSRLQSDRVSMSVYKYNPTAIFIIVVYVFYLFWTLGVVLSMSMGYAGVFIFGGIAIFVPLYIQNTNNPTFRMKIPDEEKLVFSTRGIQMQKDPYPIEFIESAVVYLESFKGFRYRDRISLGKTVTCCDGDNNKISFRFKGEVIDLIFIIESATDYWTFKNLMSSWSNRGIYVVLQRVFEDEFIIQEMIHFQHSASAS